MKVVIIHDKTVKADIRQECLVFSDPDAGVAHVLGHLHEHMAVFTGLTFKDSPKTVMDILDAIRKRTRLVHVSVVTDSDLNSLDDNDMIRLIDDPNLSYLSSFDNLQNAADKIEEDDGRRFDCVLEEWLMKHPEEKDKVAMRHDGVDYTMNDILREVRMKTKCGIDFEIKTMRSVMKKLSK